MCVGGGFCHSYFALGYKSCSLCPSAVNVKHCFMLYHCNCEATSRAGRNKTQKPFVRDDISFCAVTSSQTGQQVISDGCAENQIHFSAALKV